LGAFGVLNPEKISYKNFTRPHHPSDVATLPWEIQKAILMVLSEHTSDYLYYLRRKQAVIHLPTLPENVTTLTCECRTFSSD